MTAWQVILIVVVTLLVVALIHNMRNHPGKVQGELQIAEQKGSKIVQWIKNRFSKTPPPA